MLDFDKNKILEELKLFNRTDLAERIYNIVDIVAERKLRKNLRTEIKSIFNELFGKAFDKNVSIPYEFLETVTGEVLFTAFFNLEQYLTIADVMEVTGYSRQWIWQCIRDGKIKGAAKLGRDYIIPSSAINDLM